MQKQTIVASILLTIFLPAKSTGSLTEINVAPQAKLRVHSTNKDNTVVTEWTSKHCASGKSREVVFLGPRANLLFDRGTVQRLGIPLLGDLPQKQTAEFHIPAGEPYHLEMRQPISSRISGTFVDYEWCGQIIKFNPAQDSFYEAVYSVGKVPGEDSLCRIVLFRIVKSDSEIFTREPEPFSTLKVACK